ncbi:hypothetical protein H9Y04_36175 [Streptomyces sp. TRM66268-LWL]|uniref:Uncharacterized protein n=1 Tax=Streptomyces polyasparticus TaxID=2767826 RepID=A0ABR7ST71_9ACTN|nr:hypothetical protein [Streptomyces polyasparticus]MBC9717984.1 hypothetical protein [Streptomyces polyasparticus]
MITTVPVGDWSWEITPSAGTAKPTTAMEIALAVWGVLAADQLAVPTGHAQVTARTVADMRDIRLDLQGLPVSTVDLTADSALAHAMAQTESLDGDVLVTVRIQCPGTWREAGTVHRAEQLFAIQVDIWKGALVVVTLETYSDAWLTLDTRERTQPEIHAENAPRLTAALQGISKLLGGLPTPGDANRHATPTETGFEDLTVEGPAYTDSWGTFEVPTRAKKLLALLPPTENTYEEVTEHPVRYLPVRRDGEVLGYLWASLGDNAAGFEPRTAAGEAAFEAGAAWVLRLREAHALGLSATEALDRLCELAPPAGMGSIAGETPLESPTLDAVEDLSGRY